ncbi:RNA polymerase sigma factor [Chitinophaga sp. 212800010-3]|uniref:RNA polymerase sigma factor n=1 Tax=unclassified Chitinophaga TaxID=2619133 RepID=UPI002DE5271A|nr:hypothetical protein [Chitinophaga sp. 212800010-3]
MNTDPLLQQLKEGDPGALKNLYTTYFNMLYAKAFSIVGDEFIAKDLVQNCFLEVYEKKTYLQVHTSLQAYLMVSIRRQCFLFIKEQRRKKAQMSRYMLTLEQPTDFISEKITQEDRACKGKELNKALGKLSPQEMKVLETVVFQGKTHKEAAAINGMNAGTLHTYIYRAFGKLKKYVSAS